MSWIHVPNGRNPNGKIWNPYAPPAVAAAAQIPTIPLEVDRDSNSTVVNNINMGLQSQLRNGSIATMRRRATGRTGRNAAQPFRQGAIPGGWIFIPNRHCKVCKAEHFRKMGRNVNLPHRSHHRRCPRNRSTRGTSATTVASVQEDRRLAAVNTAGQNTIMGRRLDTEMASVHPFFSRNDLFETRAPAQTQSNFAESPPLPSPIEQARNRENPTSIGGDITIHMSEYLRQKAASNIQDTYKWLDKTKYPRPLMLAVDYIIRAIDPATNFKKATLTSAPLPRTPAFFEGMAVYNKYFGSTLECIIPPDASVAPPSPYYESIVGQSILYVDWKVVSPSLDLYCFHCHQSGVAKNDCCLSHDRTNWSKAKALFPIWDHQGRPKLAIVMEYKCQRCNVNFKANDGLLLHTLPAHIRALYPVDPIFCTGTFHFHKDLTDDLNLLMKTYANGFFVGKKLFRKLGIQYTRVVDCYLSKVEHFQSQHPNQQIHQAKFVSFEAFIRGF